MKKLTTLMIASALVLSGCKPDIPPVAVPLTKDLTGVEAPCENLTYYGFPQNKPIEGSFFVCRQGYALNYDPTRKTSVWVTERLTAENLNKPNQNRDIDDSRPDPLLAVKAQSQNNEFVGIGYQKANFISPDNFKYDDILYSHAFYLSNAFPIHPDKMVVWKTLEENIRDIAKERGEIFVVSGSIYQNGLGRGWVGVPDDLRSSGRSASNRGKIQVPTHIFKAVIDPARNQSMAFVVPNQPSTDDPTPVYMINLKDLEKISDITFAPTLDPQKENILKNQSFM